MPRTSPSQISYVYSPTLIAATHQNCGKLAKFLATYRGASNDNAGKYGVALKTIQRLFDDTWRSISTGDGHIKLEHRITGVVLEYKNHDNDPVDPGAVVSLAESLQNHINIFFEKYLGYPTREKAKHTRDFDAIAKRLNKRIDDDSKEEESKVDAARPRRKSRHHHKFIHEESKHEENKSDERPTGRKAKHRR